VIQRFIPFFSPSIKPIICAGVRLQDPQILITTYQQAFLVRGGGEYEIFSLADSLKQQGFIADIYGPYSRPLENYDVVIHFSVHGGGLDLLREIKAAGKRIVLWPNLWIQDKTPASIELVNAHVALADVVLFKSAVEQLHFSANFHLPMEKAFRVNTSADPSYKKQAPDGLFKSLFGIQNYAIWFGVIEPNKNQLAAIKALRDKGIPLVLVGHSREESYYEQCREAGGDSVLFIKALPQKSEIVRAALREALFYIEIPHEPPGLSAIEAGLAGCRLLLSDDAWSREHFGEHAIFANPADQQDIGRAVDEILTKPKMNPALNAHLERFCLPTALAPLTTILREIAP
jgi:glycosyltransferase involved in cell wall biosynthesis